MKGKKFISYLLFLSMVVSLLVPNSIYAVDGEGEEIVKADVSVEKIEIKDQGVGENVEGVEVDENALPPQMGWSTWNFFREQVDEEKIMNAAKAMVDSGLVDSGYTYLNIDDTWQSSMRDENTGSMMFDLDNFPSGPKMIDNLHDMGLKVGLYSSSGELTCEDLPGSYGNEMVDALAFARWGVDYIKYDYCHVVDLPTDPQGGDNFTGLTSAPDVDYISLVPYTGEVSSEKIKIEAEGSNVERTGNLSIQSEPRTSGGRYVTGLGNNGGDLIFKDVNVNEGGRYILTIGYRKTRSERGRFAEILVNDTNRYEAHISRSSGWSKTGRHQLIIDLNEGSNTILIHNPLTGQQSDAIRRYKNMGNALKEASQIVGEENNGQGKPIFFSICEHGRSAPWNWAQGIGNSWRTSHDIFPNWNSVVKNYESSVSHWDKQIPGSYNDPDMMQVGNGDLTDVENKAHFTLWSMLQAPLILGNDIRDFIPEEGKDLPEKTQKVFEIVTNEDIIALNQDVPLLQSKRISTANGMDILVKPLKNKLTGEIEFAICFFNKVGINNNRASVDLDNIENLDVRLKELGFTSDGLYKVKDLWTKEERVIGGTLESGQIPSHGVEVYRVSKAESGTLDKLTKLNINSEKIYTANEEQAIEVEFSNLGKKEIKNLKLSLGSGEDVVVKESESEIIPSLKLGEKAKAIFHVTFPNVKATNQDAYFDTYELNLNSTFTYEGESEVEEENSQNRVMVSSPVISEDNKDVKLGDVNWLSTSTGWEPGPTRRNLSIEGNKISIGQEKFDSGIGIHATSNTEIYLGGNSRKFTATVGVDDEVYPFQERWAPSITFIILSDGEEIYRTEEMKYGQKEEISLDLPPTKILTLRADQGETNSSDHGGFANARLVLQETITRHNISIGENIQGGKITSDKEGFVNDGESVIVSFLPDEGNTIKEAKINGLDIKEDLIPNEDGTFTYTIENIKEDILIEGSFEREDTSEVREIKEIKDLKTIIAYGIPEDKLDLSKDVLAILDDGSELRVEIESWESMDYDGWKEGEYEFSGKIKESEGYTNPNNIIPIQIVEVSLPSDNIALLAKASVEDGASAIQEGVEKNPAWLNDDIFDDLGRPEKDGVYAFDKNSIPEKSYFDLTWDGNYEVDRVVLNTYFGHGQGPTGFEIYVKNPSGEYEKVGEKKNITWPESIGREQYQSEIVFDEPLKNVGEMRVKITDSNIIWGVSAITEFQVYGREIFNILIDPKNDEDIEKIQVPKESWLNLEDPTYEGHIFKGWFEDEEYTIPYERASVLRDLNLYGKWEKLEEKYFQVNIGDLVNGRITVEDNRYKAGDKVEIKVEADEGYRLKEGSLRANGNLISENFFIMPGEDVLISGEFEKIDPIGPVEPEEPVDPEEPEEPVDPEEPESPTDPEEPETPEEPEDPENPVDPEVPEVPGKPEEPNKPETPEDPKEPTSSEKPSKEDGSANSLQKPDDKKNNDSKNEAPKTYDLGLGLYGVVLVISLLSIYYIKNVKKREDR